MNANKPVAELVLEQMAVGDASSLRVKWLVDNYPPVGTKLYTHPVELTDEEINIVGIKTLGSIWNCYDEELVDFARAILRKASEK